MDQPLDQMPAGGATNPTLFKNPLVIISLIVFILALAFAGYGWWLKNAGLVAPAANQPLSEAEKLVILKNLQNTASSTPLSTQESVKILKSLQSDSKDNTSVLTAEEKLNILKSLQQ